MAMRGNLDNWRKFFGFSPSNIFDIIDNAILVAASDDPREFNLRKHGIAKALISPALTPLDFAHCSVSQLCLTKFFDGMHDDGSDPIDHQNSGEFKNMKNPIPLMGKQNVPKPKQPILPVQGELDIPGMDKKGEQVRKRRRLIKKQTAAAKPNKPSNTQSGAARLSRVNEEQKEKGSSTETRLHQKSDKAIIQKKPLLTPVQSSFSLNKEEEQSQIIVKKKILTIKEVLDNSQHESDSIVYDSLRKLQLMTLSMDILEATQIGRSVSALRNHESKPICHLAKTLVKVWKEIVDEWIKSTEATTDPQNSGNVKLKNTENGRPSISMGNQNVPKPKQPVLSELDIPTVDKKGEEIKKRPLLIRIKLPARQTKVDTIANQKVTNDTEFQQKLDMTIVQKKPLPLAKLKCLDDTAKLEAAKRKLHKRYQEIENGLSMLYPP
ncbi:hypothetical protein U1Q18_013808 [Sarracenia purpurea var. burkii]